MEKYRNTNNNNRGFSLVELIIVIAIMAILIGILAPQFIKYVEKSRDSKCVTQRGNYESAFQVKCTDDEDFLNKAINNASDSDELKAMAEECMGDKIITCPSGGADDITCLFDPDSNTIHIYCKQHVENSSLPDSTTDPEKSADALKEALDKWESTSPDWRILDSNGTKMTLDFQKILDEALAKYGYKMSSTAMWRVNRNHYDDGDEYKIYWIDTGEALKAGSYTGKGIQINISKDGSTTIIKGGTIYIKEKVDPNTSGNKYLGIDNSTTL